MEVGVEVEVELDWDAGVLVNTGEGCGVDVDPNPQANIKRIRVERANESLIVLSRVFMGGPPCDMISGRRDAGIILVSYLD
jgi:hypothetical protein